MNICARGTDTPFEDIHEHEAQAFDSWVGSYACKYFRHRSYIEHVETDGITIGLGRSTQRHFLPQNTWEIKRYRNLR
jgi:hypothetical protein